MFLNKGGFCRKHLCEGAVLVSNETAGTKGVTSNIHRARSIQTSHTTTTKTIDKKKEPYGSYTTNTTLPDQERKKQTEKRVKKKRNKERITNYNHKTPNVVKTVLLYSSCAV